MKLIIGELFLAWFAYYLHAFVAAAVAVRQHSSRWDGVASANSGAKVMPGVWFAVWVGLNVVVFAVISLWFR